MPGALSRSYVACARSRKPPNIVSSAATNCDRSVQHLGADDPGEHAGEDAEPGGDDLEVGLAAGLGRREQDPDHPAVEERSSAAAGRRGSPAPTGSAGCRRRRGRSRPAGAQLAELLHRHVLLRPGERGRQRLVEGVGQDRLGLARRRRASTTSSSNVRFMSSIIASSCRRRRSGRRRPPRGVVELGQAHRLREPAGRVDGEHDGAAARARRRAARARRRSSSCRRRRSRSRRGSARCRRRRVDVEHRCGGCGAVMRSPGPRARRRARTARRGRRRRAAAAARTSAGRSAASASRPRSSSATRRGVVGGLGGQRASTRARRRRRGRPAPARPRALGASSVPVLGGRAGRPARSSGARDRVDDDAADRQVDRPASSAIAVDRSPGPASPRAA